MKKLGSEFKEFIIKLNHEFRDTLGLYTGIRLGYSNEFDLTNTIKNSSQINVNKLQ